MNAGILFRGAAAVGAVFSFGWSGPSTATAQTETLTAERRLALLAHAAELTGGVGDAEEACYRHWLIGRALRHLGEPEGAAGQLAKARGAAAKIGGAAGATWLKAVAFEEGKLGTLDMADYPELEVDTNLGAAAALGRARSSAAAGDRAGAEAAFREAWAIGLGDDTEGGFDFYLSNILLVGHEIGLADAAEALAAAAEKAGLEDEGMPVAPDFRRERAALLCGGDAGAKARGRAEFLALAKSELERGDWFPLGFDQTFMMMHEAGLAPEAAELLRPVLAEATDPDDDVFSVFSLNLGLGAFERQEGFVCAPFVPMFREHFERLPDGDAKEETRAILAALLAGDSKWEEAIALAEERRPKYSKAISYENALLAASDLGAPEPVLAKALEGYLALIAKLDEEDRVDFAATAISVAAAGGDVAGAIRLAEDFAGQAGGDPGECYGALLEACVEAQDWATFERFFAKAYPDDEDPWAVMQLGLAAAGAAAAGDVANAMRLGARTEALRKKIVPDDPGGGSAANLKLLRANAFRAAGERAGTREKVKALVDRAERPADRVSLILGLVLAGREGDWPVAPELIDPVRG